MGNILPYAIPRAEPIENQQGASGLVSPVIRNKENEKEALRTTEVTRLQQISTLPPFFWNKVLSISNYREIARLSQVCSAFYRPAKRILGGNVSLFAGSGLLGNMDGPCENATFTSIRAIAVDKRDGAVYVADESNIRKIVDGRVSTLSTSDENGTVTFKQPISLSVAEGHIYVLDVGTESIHKISPEGVVSTVCKYRGGGNDVASGQAAFPAPKCIAVREVDHAILATDSSNNNIRKVDNNRYVTIAGLGAEGFKDGPGVLAQFTSPVGLAVSESDRSIYVADQHNERIRKVTADDRVSTVFCGSGMYTGTGLFSRYWSPKCITMGENGLIYVTEGLSGTRKPCIQRISRDGKISTVKATEMRKGGPGDVDFREITGIAYHDGTIYVTEASVIKQLLL